MSMGASLAMQGVWLINGQPPDALPHLGNDRRLRRYIVETDEDYRARLERAVEIWESGGAAPCIIGELNSASYEESQVHSPLDWVRTPLDWPSQIWVFLPRQAHLDGTPFHFCGAGVSAGSGAAICGTGTTFKPPKRVGSADAVVGSHLIGITGPIEHIVELQHIVKTFKAGHEVCRQIVIEIHGHTAGTGVLAGGSAAICGGALAYIGTGVPET
jgi:hypothetical protein